MNLRKVQWTSVRVELPKGSAQDWIDSQLALNTLGYQLKPKRHTSSLWGRINQGNIAWYHVERDAGNQHYYYEILIPGLKERQIDILKDLGYNVRDENTILSLESVGIEITRGYKTLSRKYRRKHFYKIRL